MDRIRTLIVDDEPLARQGIRVLLEQHPDVAVVGECPDGETAVRALATLRPDLVFLDVQMPEMDGFDVLAAVEPEARPVVVFVTAFDEHALRAFDVHALDYLLKPFSDDRFGQALDRARTQVRQQQVSAIGRRLADLLDHRSAPSDASPPVAPEPAYLTRLVVKSGGRISFVSVDDIDWIEAADYYVRLHVGKKSHLLRETLSGLVRQLDPGRFQRIHRSTVVNLDRVATLEAYTHGDYSVTLRDGTRLRLSRRYRARLEAALGRTL